MTDRPYTLALEGDDAEETNAYLAELERQKRTVPLKGNLDKPVLQAKLFGVTVSIPSRIDRNATPRSCRLRIASIKPPKDCATRSSCATTISSPAVEAFNAARNCGLTDVSPSTARSS